MGDRAADPSLSANELGAAQAQNLQIDDSSSTPLLAQQAIVCAAERCVRVSSEKFVCSRAVRGPRLKN